MGKRKIDGRLVHGTRMALEAALNDEAKDAHLIELVNQGYNWTQIAQELGMSRQRATELCQRAIVRKAMLKEYRAGKTVDHMSSDWQHIYPQGKRGRGGSSARRAGAQKHRNVNGGPSRGSADHDHRTDISAVPAEGEAHQDHQEEVGEART